jgi:hypothetical protein
MPNHTIELTVTIGSTEVPASVDFDFSPGCAAWGGARFEPATNPPEEAHPHRRAEMNNPTDLEKAIAALEPFAEVVETYERSAKNGVLDLSAVDKLGVDHLRAAAAALPGLIALRDGAGWQPIETAPKDGAHFLAYWPNPYGNNLACWVETWWGFSSNGDEAWQSPFEAAEGDNIPTHFMPLPTPPASHGEG